MSVAEQLEQPQDAAAGGKFLKLALHVIALVPDIARALNITEAAAGWGLVRLHYWTRQQRALLTAPATVPISFLGAFWPGVAAVEQLAELLVMLGVGRREGASIVYLPEAEYSRVSNLRAEGGRAAAANLRRGSTPPGATGGGAGHGRPTLPQASSGLAPEGRGGFPPASSRHMPGTSRGDAGRKVHLEERPEKRSDLRSTERDDLQRGKPSLSAKALWEKCNETRRALKLRAAPQPEAFAAWHKRALELASEAAILAGYEAFCRSRYWRERACPWSAWAKRWQDFAHEPEAPTAAAPACEVCGVADAVQVYEHHLCRAHWAGVNAVVPSEYSDAVPFVTKWIAEQQKARA